MTDQNIFVRLAANITGFRADMAKAAQALRGVGQTAAAASAQASAAAKTMGQAMDDAHKKTQRLSGGMKGVGAQLSAIAAGLGVGWGLKAASEIETITIGFEGMLGSAEEADEFVRELQQFAAVTPFEFPGLAKAAQQFLGLGYSTEEAMARVDAIGRALATTGNLSDEAVTRVTRALAQIQGKGKLAAQELNQINENLPNLQRTMVYDVIAEKMDKTREQVVKLADEGLIPAEVALDAIYEVMTELPGAAESFEKSSQTLAGMMSTLKDNLRFAAAEGFKPLAQAIKDTLGPLLSQLGPLLGTILGPLGEGLADVFAGLAQTFTTLGPRLGELADVVGSLLSALAPLVPLAAGLLNAVLIPLLPVIQAVAGALEFLMNDIPGLQGALQGLATAFIALKVMSSLPAIMSALSTAYTAIGVTAINAGAGVAKLRVALTGLMSSAGGIGLVLSAAAAAYSLFAAGNAEAEDSTKSFTDAINAQKFATDAAVKSWLLQELTTGNYIQLLNQAGISVEDFIKGSTDINKVTGATGEKFTDLQHALRAAMEAGNLTEEEWDKLGAAAFDVYGKLNQMQNAARATAGVTDALGLSAGEVAPELKDLAKSIEDMTDAGDAFKDFMDEQEQAIDDAFAAEEKARDKRYDKLLDDLDRTQNAEQAAFKARREQLMEDLEARQAIEEKALEDRHESEVEALEKRNEAEQKAIDERHEIRVRAYEREARDLKNALDDQQAIEKDAFDQRMEDLRDFYDEQIEDENDAWEKRKEHLEWVIATTWGAERQAAVDALASEEEAHEERVDTLEEQGDAAVDAETREFDKRKRAQDQALDDRLQGMRDYLDDVKEAEQAAWDDAYQREKTALTNRHELEKTEAQKRWDDQKTALTNETTQLQAALDDQHKRAKTALEARRTLENEEADKRKADAKTKQDVDLTQFQTYLDDKRKKAEKFNADLALIASRGGADVIGIIAQMGSGVVDAMMKAGPEAFNAFLESIRASVAAKGAANTVAEMIQKGLIPTPTAPAPRPNAEGHYAQIAPPGTWRLWAEPETGGEAYIPLAASKRTRSTAILAQTAHAFGYGLVRFADGGMIGGGSTSSVGVMNQVNVHVRVAAGVDPDRVGYAVRREVERALDQLGRQVAVKAWRN